MTFQPDNFTVWMEIPVTDLEAATTFYEKVTGGALDRAEMGGAPVAVFRTKEAMKGIAGHLRIGTPAQAGSGATVHIMCAGKVEDAMARAVEAGGQLVNGPVEIPQGRFAYCTDLDGNSIGLYEPCAS